MTAQQRAAALLANSLEPSTVAALLEQVPAGVGYRVDLEGEVTEVDVYLERKPEPEIAGQLYLDAATEV